MSSAILEPATRPSPATADPAENAAVVRMWWALLERGWRAALREHEDGQAAGALVEECVRDALAPFEDFDAAIEELRAEGDLVLLSLRLRGRLAGREVRMREAWACRLHEGTVVEVSAHSTIEAARTAAGA